MERARVRAQRVGTREWQGFRFRSLVAWGCCRGVQVSALPTHLSTPVAGMDDKDYEAKVVQAELAFCRKELEDDGLRADELISYAKKVPEPFSDSFTGENAWISSKSGGGSSCVIL
jgi:hypothetical protein